MTRYEAGEKITLHVFREESNFDRACDNAYRQALMRFGCEDGGYLTNVKDSERSTDSVAVEFVLYRMDGSMGGHSHYYEFVTWVDRVDDDEDETTKGETDEVHDADAAG